MTDSAEIIESDIWDWIINYVEKNHEFYDDKFPPCPFARTARLKKALDVQVFPGGDFKQFITSQTHAVIGHDKINTRVLAFPSYYRWFFHCKSFIREFNEQVIPQDYYLQYGKTVDKTSRFREYFLRGPYFIVIINKVSDVINGHYQLLKTDYYKPWSKKHYEAVVTRRQEMFDKHTKE